jgi:hypothetical protein
MILILRNIFIISLAGFLNLGCGKPFSVAVKPTVCSSGAEKNVPRFINCECPI